MVADIFYQVTIKAGSEQYDLSHDISSLTVEETSGKPDALTINLSDPDKVFSHAFQEGMTVEVDLGTVEEHSLLFRGRIYKVDGAFPRDEVPTLRLLAHDASMPMGLRRRNRPWADMSLSDIVQTIAGDYFAPTNIVIDLGDEGDLFFQGNGIRQRERTDLDFLNYLAQRYGCELYVMPEEQGDTLYFASQYHIMTSEPEVTVHHGRCNTANRLYSFEASTNVSTIQLPRVISGMDYESGAPTETQTSEVEQVGYLEDTFIDENMTALLQRNPDQASRLQGLIAEAPIVHEELRTELGTVERQAMPTFLTEEELRVIASNQFSTSIHGMRGNGSTHGNPSIHANSVIDIADVGGRFSGTWYLSEVRHTLDAQGYQTDFECQR